MQVNFLNRYLYSPRTWLHSICSYIKISVIFTSLYLVNYVNSQSINIVIIYYTIVLISLKLPRKYIVEFLKIIILIILPTLLVNLVQKKLLYLNIYENFNIHIPFSIKFLYQNKSKRNIIKILYYSCFLPDFLFRAYSLSLLNFLSLQILFITTLYEDIIIYVISLYRFINLKKNKTINTLILILACSSQFLTEIINYLCKTFISFKAHNYSINTYHIIMLYIAGSIIKFIKTYVYNITMVVHTRGIVNSHI